MSRVLYNACIYTLDSSRPTASAVVIDGERILALGDDHTILSEFEGRSTSLDMNGRVIIPGLTDAHIHLEHYALSLQKIDCETATRAECLRRIAERVRSMPPNSWILGHGWNQNNWPEGYGTAVDLDSVAPRNPVYLTAKSLHAAWANTSALRLANIHADTPDPSGGRLGRDENGLPNGILLESAMELVSSAVPEASLEQVWQAIHKAQPVLWQMGLTGVHDFDRRRCFLALQRLHQQEELRLRVVKSIHLDDLPHAIAVGLRTGFGDNFLQIGSIKAFSDGALGPHTAAMLQAYEDTPDDRGMLLLDAEELFDYGRQAAESGLSLAVHAIGDRANHEVLEAFHQLRAYERKNQLASLRHRIEHVQMIHPDDAHRLAELEVIASMQPLHATSDMLMADRFWGSRAAYSYAWRTQLQAGARLAFGSDAPVESPNPFWGLHAAVTRRRADGSPGPEGWYPFQRLSVEEALRAYTSGPAFAAGMEDRLGRLASGFLADLLVLDSDPFTCDPEMLLSIRPVGTMVAGEWVYRQF